MGKDPGFMSDLKAERQQSSGGSHSEGPLKVCMDSFRSLDERMHVVHEVLYGSDRKPGLVWTVESLAGSVEQAVNVLLGPGGAGGLVASVDTMAQRVDRHDRKLEKWEKQITRAMWLLVTNFITVLSFLGVVVWQAMMGGVG